MNELETIKVICKSHDEDCKRKGVNCPFLKYYTSKDDCSLSHYLPLDWNIKKMKEICEKYGRNNE